MATQFQDENIERFDENTFDLVHQALRRELNEGTRSAIHEVDEGEQQRLQVFCECVQANCMEHMVMTVAEYDAVRRFPTRFFIKQAHEVAAGERAVAASARYVVVEKFGDEGRGAVRTNPRDAHADRGGNA